MGKSGCRGDLTPAMSELIDSIRSDLSSDPDPPEAARAAAERVSGYLGRDDLLTAAQREASADEYTQHVLHVEEDGSFSVVSLVWLEGQDTPIHDHVAWCVPAVHRGREEEVRYRLVDRAPAAGGDGDGRGRHLVPAGTGVNEAGDVTALTPPGDIHRVRNPGPEKAISIHVYGADIERLGSSIRHTYDLEVREATEGAAVS